MPPERVVCPRCRAESARDLGKAGSQLNWYTCGTCHHIWAHGAGVSAPAALPHISHRSSPLDARQHVLVVDDDLAMVSFIARALDGYRVSTAGDAKEALAVLLSADPIDLLITDYLMPGMTGDELVQSARASTPRLQVLVITGHGHTLAAADPGWWAREAHLEKPFHLPALRVEVERLIGPARVAI
jgi:CheY-like chemotaxis protein